MTEAVQAETAATSISLEDARARYSASKAAAKAEPGKDAAGNPVSDAARTLGQRAAEARAQRQAEAAAKSEQTSHEDGSDVADSPDGTQDETVANVQSGGDEADDGQSAEQDIDLGDGTKVTKEEVRESFFRHSDYTKKTQSLAEDRKTFESHWKQSGELMNVMLTGMQSELGPIKAMDDYVAELGFEQGYLAFSRQQKKVEQIGTAIKARQQLEAQHSQVLRDSTVRALSEKHGAKAKDHYDTAVKYVAAGTGMDEDYLSSQLANPWVVETVHKAKAWDDLQAKRGDVNKFVADKPKVIKPGVKTPQQSAGQASISNGFAKLKSSGNPADAVALWRSIKTGGKR